MMALTFTKNMTINDRKTISELSHNNFDILLRLGAALVRDLDDFSPEILWSQARRSFFNGDKQWILSKSCVF